jgi:hypothetical protein
MSQQNFFQILFQKHILKSVTGLARL